MYQIMMSSCSEDVIENVESTVDSVGNILFLAENLCNESMIREIMNGDYFSAHKEKKNGIYPLLLNSKYFFSTKDSNGTFYLIELIESIGKKRVTVVKCYYDPSRNINIIGG